MRWLQNCFVTKFRSQIVVEAVLQPSQYIMVLKKTLGIIFKRVPFRDNDRFFTIFTQEYGKIQTIARGVRKIKSKLAANLEPFSLIDLTLAQGQNFNQIIGAEFKKNYFSKESNINKIMTAGRMLLITNELTRPEHQDEKIFLLLDEFLSLIGNYDLMADFTILADNYLLKFIALLGYTPELYFCVSCRHKLLPGDNFFHFLKGGVICEKCFFLEKLSHKDKAPLLSTNTIKILRLLLREKLGYFVKVKTYSEDLIEARRIITLLLKHLWQS